MPNEWPWYEAIQSTTDLQQGDILEGVEVPILDRFSGDMVVEEYDLVVMTQSCDIEDDIDHIVFCPVWDHDQEEIASSFNNKSKIDSLLKGRTIGFYPISKSALPECSRPWRIVQFQRMIELSRSDVFDQMSSMGTRLRMLPPYRESLSQQFARFFMRVGLPIPVDID